MYEPNLLAWQWALYAENHRSRGNLLVHLLVVPVFECGGVALVLAPFVGHPGWALVGAAAMTASIAAQGRGHRLEGQQPVPFRGPVDAVVRILAEQFITFPRFVLSGHFAAAWKTS
jgi:hypothetical protein